MGKKNLSRKLRRHPELLGQMQSEVGMDKLPRVIDAHIEDIPELLAWERNHPEDQA